MKSETFEYEYREFTPEEGVKRANTDALTLIRVNKEKALDITKREFNELSYPGTYILINDEAKKAYVGQTTDVSRRLMAHTTTSPEELNEWQYCIIIWDGRPFNTSFLSDASLREDMEFEIENILKLEGSLDIVSRVTKPPLSVNRSVKAKKVLPELIYLLYKFNLISHSRLMGFIQRQKFEKEIDPLELEVLLRQKGHVITDMNRALRTFVLDGKQAFYRPGSKKERGWQITIRGTFKDIVERPEEKGYLVVTRGDGYITPIKVIRDNFQDLMIGQDTLDIFIDIGARGEALIICHDREVDISEYKLT